MEKKINAWAVVWRAGLSCHGSNASKAIFAEKKQAEEFKKKEYRVCGSEVIVVPCTITYNLKRGTK